MGFVADVAKDAVAEPGGKFVPSEKAKLDKEIANENVRIPGTDVRVPGSSDVSQFLISTGRGVVDLWAGAKQAALGAADIVSPRQTKMSDLIPGGTPTRLAEYTKGETDELNRFKPMEDAAPVTAALGRATGATLPMLAIPGGSVVKGFQTVSKLPMLSVLARAGTATEAATLGGAQAGLSFTPEGQSTGEHVIEGALMSGVIGKGMEVGGRVLGPTIAKGVNWMRDKVDALTGRVGLAESAGTRAAASSDDVAAALKTEGIDWQTLPTRVREGITQLADDAAKSGAPITPTELARVARAQNLPGGRADLTKGQMTQNRAQLRDEFDLRRTRAGATLDDQLVQQDKVLADSLDVMKLRSGGSTVEGRDAEAGQKITKPLLDQLRSAQGKVTSLYEKADNAKETLAKVDIGPLADYLAQNRAVTASVPELKTIMGKLQDLGMVSSEGKIIATGQPSIRDLEEIRKLGVKLGRSNDAAGHWMGEVNRIIDQITEGKGGEYYAAARAARIELREKFEDPGVIRRLVGENKTGDRLTPFEDVFDRSVLKGSVDDLKVLRGQLLGGASDMKGTAAGIQAFRDLRGATLDYIKMGAMNNAKDEFSYAGLKKAVDSIGAEKLEALFGKNTANELMSVVESAKDMKAVFNKAGIYNPGTASAFVDWIDRVTGFIGMSKAGTYGKVIASGTAKKVMDHLQQPRLVDEATRPVEAAMRAGAEAKDAVYRDLIGLYAGRTGARAGQAGAAAVAEAKPDEK